MDNKMKISFAFLVICFCITCGQLMKANETYTASMSMAVVSKRKSQVPISDPHLKAPEKANDKDSVDHYDYDYEYELYREALERERTIGLVIILFVLIKYSLLMLYIEYIE